MTTTTNISFRYAFLLIANMLLISSGKLSASDDKSHPIEFICSKAQDPDFCRRVLGSDPRSRSAGIAELGQIIVDFGLSNATAAEAKIKKMLASEKDTQIRAHLTECDDNYHATLILLKGCADFLKDRDYASLNVSGVDVSTRAHMCEDEFKKSPTRKFPFVDETYLMDRFSDILLVISFHL